MNSKLILMLIVLVFEAAVLVYFFKWSPLKSIGISVLINLCSSIAVAIVQNFVSLKLPVHVWHIYIVTQQYFQLMLPLMAVAFVTTVLVEYFLCNMFLKEIPHKKAWMVIIGMNVITILILSGSMIFINRPEVSPGYSLVERAEWLGESGETLQYIDWQSQNLISWAIGTEKGAIVAKAVPMAGYRVTSVDIPVVTRTPTNTVALIGKTIAASKTLPVTVESCRNAAVSPDAQHVAVYAGKTITVFSLANGQPVNVLPTIDSGDDSCICWSTNGVDILFGSSSSTLSSIAWNSTNALPDAATAAEALHSTIFDKELYMETTNSFTSGDTTATVYMHNGILIRTPRGESTFFIDCKSTPALYSGIGFIDGGKTFLFQLFSYSREIMALNVETGQAGHVVEGIMAALDINPYLVPPAPEQP
jgi:hypothetical protein